VATVYITEYSIVAWVHMPGFGVVPMPQDPPVAEQTVPITGASVQSAPFNVRTRFLRINTDAVCSILVGTNPTVTTGSGRFAANQTEYRGVLLGGSFQLAAIANV
jgi:hypothetical protein